MERLKQAIARAVEQRKKFSGDSVNAARRHVSAQGGWLAVALVVLVVAAGVMLVADKPGQTLAVADMSALEAGTPRYTTTGDKLDVLIHKIDVLAASVTLLEGKMERLGMLINTTHAGATATDVGPAKVAVAPAVERAEAVASGDEQRSGHWVVTLASLPSKVSADRFAKVAQGQGVKVQQQRVKVAGQDFWRVQVADFATAEDARAYAGRVEARLGLEDVWVSRR